MKKILFAHRPPSVGIHLLSDPFPERIESTVSNRATSGAVTSSKKKNIKAKSKKSGLHS